jgi:hypothetical protein
LNFFLDNGRNPSNKEDPNLNKFYKDLLAGQNKAVLDEICEKNSAFKTWFEGERLEFSKRRVVKSHKETPKEKGE